MKTFLAKNIRAVQIGTSLVAVFLGIAVGSYLIHRYSVKGVPSFKREYDLVLKKYDGTDMRLASFKNKLLVVTAWASWCPYCKAELENLSTVSQEHGAEIQIVAINRGESRADAKPYSDALTQVGGVAFLLDPTDAFYKELGGYAMPETLFIDAYGHVLFHQRGPMSIELMREKIRELVN